MKLEASIAKSLLKPESLSSKQCTELIDKIEERLFELSAEIATTSKDTKLRLLDAEQSALYFHRGALKERRLKAAVEETPGRVAIALKKLPAALEAAELSIVAKDTAMADLERITNEITTATHIAIQAELITPVMETEVFDRLADCMDWIDDRSRPARDPGAIRNAYRRQRALFLGREALQPNQATPDLRARAFEQLRLQAAQARKARSLSDRNASRVAA